MKSILKNRQSGFAILEALFAFLLLGGGVMVLLYLQGNLMGSSTLSKARAEAMELANDRTEKLRNYIQRDQYLSALTAAQASEPVGGVAGVNATYNVSYGSVPTSASDAQLLTVAVNWTGSDGTPEDVTLETMLYFSKPAVTASIGSENEGGAVDPSDFKLPSPWLTGVEGDHDTTDGQTLTFETPSSETDADGIPTENFYVMKRDIDTGAISYQNEEVKIKTYVDSASGHSNVEVWADQDGDGALEVVLTSFGGIVHKIRGKIIIDKFTVILDGDNNGVLSQAELKNYWTDSGDGNGVIDVGEVKDWTDGSNAALGGTLDGIIQGVEISSYWYDYAAAGGGTPDDGLIQPAEFGPAVGLDSSADGIIDETEINGGGVVYWFDTPDGRMQENEVKYWIDGSGASQRIDATGAIVAEPDGLIQQDEYTYWVDADHDDIVDVGEFDPPTETGGAKSTFAGSSADTQLNVKGSPPSFCLFPICDESDTTKDCKQGELYPANPANIIEYEVASYACYVPGDCTHGGAGCDPGFTPPKYLNGGWYGRVGNFSVHLKPDDMVCTADTYKQGSTLFLTPSREYVSHRWGYGCEGDLSKEESQCTPANWKWTVINNEGINTPYSNQTFFIVRKNNKPQIYCQTRANSYLEELVDEQIVRNLSETVDTSKADDPNVVLPEIPCDQSVAGVDSSCPPPP